MAYTVFDERKVYRFSEDGSVKEYDSMSAAGRDVGLNPSSIANALNGNFLRVKGYYWSRDKNTTIQSITEKYINAPILKD